MGRIMYKMINVYLKHMLSSEKIVKHYHYFGYGSPNSLEHDFGLRLSSRTVKTLLVSECLIDEMLQLFPISRYEAMLILRERIEDKLSVKIIEVF